jgi:hypothetical protein
VREIEGSFGRLLMSEEVDAKIAELGDWRGETLSRLRQLIREADPAVTEAIKWRKPSNPAGVPVWEHDGMICTGETYKDKIKLTFARGASIDDPSKLFNSSLDAGTRRAIDIREGEEVDAEAFKNLIRKAVALNGTNARAK